MIKSESNNSQCCSGGSCCCGTKKVIIDFLYLDLTQCTWCQGTEQSLEEALHEVSSVLKASGKEVEVNKINVNSEELAKQYRFVTSPTIHVNGIDIQIDMKEKKCESCGDLCGDDVDCRVWEFDGEEYTVPPKALIIESILKAVYGVENNSCEVSEYKLPENLKRFYTAMKEKSKSKSCCSGEETSKCC